jgi:hypothetical protein
MSHGCFDSRIDLADGTTASGNATVTVLTVGRGAIFTADSVDRHAAVLADCFGSAAGCLAGE